MKKSEAVRIKHLEPEIIQWQVVNKITAMKGKRVALPGQVICENSHGAQWVMSVTDFDKTFKTR